MQLAAVNPTAPSPAATFVRDAAWLLVPGSAVVGLEAVDEGTVRMTVADPYVSDPKDHAFADAVMADSARAVLEQAAHGVRLIPVTRSGHVGRVRELTPAQHTFLVAIPGVQRYDLVGEDVDGDGFVAPSERAHHIDVESPEDGRRVDWLLRDRFDEGMVEAAPVTITLPRTPWRPLPGPGAVR
jgi:hypothetical protein